jgi:hypothetical protein
MGGRAALEIRMDSIYAFKGRGKHLMSLNRPEGRIDLMSYIDGSMGIIRDHAVLGIWEYDDQDACLAEFVQLAGGKERLRAAVILLRQSAPTSGAGGTLEQPFLN